VASLVHLGSCAARIGTASTSTHNNAPFQPNTAAIDQSADNTRHCTCVGSASVAYTGGANSLFTICVDSTVDRVLLVALPFPPFEDDDVRMRGSGELNRLVG